MMYCKQSQTTEDVEHGEEVEAFAKSGDIKMEQNEVLELMKKVDDVVNIKNAIYNYDT